MRNRTLPPLVLLLSSFGLAQSDDCANPTPIAGTGNHPFSLFAHTTSGFDGGGGSCQTNINNDLFWSWTAPATGTYLFSLCGVGFDTRMALHAGVDCGATCLAYDDNGCNPMSAIQIALTVGDDLLIQVGSAALIFTGTLEIIELPSAPMNDTCADPALITGLGAFPYDRTLNTNSGFDGGDPVACGQAELGVPDRDIFFAWTPPSSGTFVFSACCEINLHLGSDCNAVCIDSHLPQACPGSDCRILHNVSSALTYLVQVGDWQSGSLAPADGDLVITAGTPPPLESSCATPSIIVGTGSFPFDSTNAAPSGFDGNGGPPCLGVDFHRDVFLHWTVPSDGDYQFDTIGTVANTRLGVYAGFDCNAVCLDFDEDSGGNGAALLTLNGLVAGSDILVQVGGWDLPSVGPGTLTIGIPAPPPANNVCGTPSLLAGEGTTPFDNTTATTSNYSGGGAPCFGLGDPVHNDLFFAWTATCDGDYQFDTEGSSLFTKINLHDGFTCGATCLASDNFSGAGGLSLVTLTNVQAGDSVLIQVGGAVAVAGTGELHINRIGGACDAPDITIACDPANNHFQGNYVKLDNSSFGSGVGSGLHVNAIDGPTSQFGFVITSNIATSGTNVFNGVLCVGLPIGRFNPQIAANQGLPVLNSLGQFDGAGVLQNLVGTSVSGDGFDVPLELPFSPTGQTIGPGETWYFQVWYRDQIATPGDSANFSNLLEVTF